MHTELTNEKKLVKCLNCGTMSDDKFCPHCGQPTATSRLKNISGLFRSFCDVVRLSGPLFHTLYSVFAHPQELIARYIKGHRVCYTAPFVFLVTSIVYSSTVKILTREFFGLNDASANDDFTLESMSTVVNDFLNWFFDNTVIMTILLAIPCIFATRIIYKKHYAARFNTVEYVVATAYISAGSEFVTAFLHPFVAPFFSDPEPIFNVSSFAYVFYACFLVARKAFPQKNEFYNVLRFFVWLLFIFILTFVYFTIVGFYL